MRGRPHKEVDTGILFHMIMNNAPVKAVACFLGIHRDTIYANYGSIIEEARLSHHAAWKIIADEMHFKFLEKRKLKASAKKKKRKYCRRSL